MLKFLSSLFKKNKTDNFKKLFIFSKVIKKAYLKLHKMFTTVLILIYYNFNLFIQMKTDALK